MLLHRNAKMGLASFEDAGVVDETDLERAPLSVTDTFQVRLEKETAHTHVVGPL